MKRHDFCRPKRERYLTPGGLGNRGPSGWGYGLLSAPSIQVHRIMRREHTLASRIAVAEKVTGAIFQYTAGVVGVAVCKR